MNSSLMKVFMSILMICCITQTSAQIWGVNYGVQRPDGSCSSYDQILADFQIIKTYSSRVRIFTVTGCNGGQNAILAGKATGISIFLSVQALPDWAYNNDKAGLQQLYNQYGFSNVLGVIVGSEDLYRGDISEDLLTQKIYDIKGFLRSFGASVPVTHADVYYKQPPQLIAAVDIVMFNAYAYWEGVNIDGALAAMQNHYSYVQSIANGKPIYIGETAWPDQGQVQANAVPSTENMRKYLNQFVCWANSIGLPYLYFEAFDEPWKGSDVEGHWGLYLADHVTKKAGFSLSCGGAPTSTSTSTSQAPTTSTSTSTSSSTRTSQVPTSTTTTNSGSDLRSALYFSFDDRNPTTVADASGNGRTGQITGALTYVTGVSGSAAKFVQSPLTYIRVPNGNTFNNVFSVSTWFFVPSQLDVRMKLASSKLNWNDASGWELEFYPTANSLNFVGAYGSVASWANLGIKLGIWNHVTVTINGNAVTMYVNGAQVGDVKYVTPVTSSSRDLYVGSNGQPDGLTGNLDEFHIFNLNLSPAQVRSVYQSTSAPTQAPTSTSTSSSQAPTTSTSTSTSTKTSSSQAPTTSTSTTSQVPTTSSSTSTPPSTSTSTPTCQGNPCGAAKCCPTPQGNQCYDSNYDCVVDDANGKAALCAAGYKSCNGACYSTMMYTCKNGGLAPK